MSIVLVLFLWWDTLKNWVGEDFIAWVKVPHYRFHSCSVESVSRAKGSVRVLQKARVHTRTFPKEFPSWYEIKNGEEWRRACQQGLWLNIKSLKQFLYIFVELAEIGSLDHPVNKLQQNWGFFSKCKSFWRYECFSITSILMWFLLETSPLCRSQIRETLGQQSSSPLQMVDKVWT